MTTILLILFIIFGGRSYPVIQQYGQEPTWISRTPGAVTQFNRGDGLGFLAHNYLAGADFAALRPGDIITVVYSDESKSYYLVSRSYDYKHIGYRLYQFTDTGQNLASDALLDTMYQPGELTLQTCIAQGGNDEWGRLFVHAHPVTFTRHALTRAPVHEAK